MTSPDSALKGFYARASQDAAVKLALSTKPGIAGSPARIVEGWPEDTLEESDTPRMTYFNVVPATRRPGFFSVQIQADGWFWNKPGFAAAREAWTLAMLALFDEQHWTYGNEARLYSTVTNPGRDFPGPDDRPTRRMMEIRVEVSPA